MTSAPAFCCHREIKLSGSCKYSREFPPTSLSEQRDVRALSLGALGGRPGCSELPQKTSEEASSSGANSDLCGGQTGRRGRAPVPAHTEAEQRFCLCYMVSSPLSNESRGFFIFIFLCRFTGWFLGVSVCPTRRKKWKR